MKKIIGFITSIIWTVYFIILALFVVGSLLANPELTLPNNYKAFITQSGSMVPTIQVGDIIIDSLDKRTVKEGDIITFKDAQHHVVTHRVVKIETKDNMHYFTTRGDNNNAPDPDKITDENIIGFYKLRLLYLGYLVIYLRKPMALLLLVLIPIILTSLGVLFDDKKQKLDNPADKKDDLQVDEVDETSINVLVEDL